MIRDRTVPIYSQNQPTRLSDRSYLCRAVANPLHLHVKEIGSSICNLNKPSICGQRHLIFTDSGIEIVTAMGILKSEVCKTILEVRHLIADAVILQLPKITLHAKQLLPEYSGIYYVLDESNNVWYIGQAKNIRKRWQGKSHHRIYQLEVQKKKHFTIYYEQVSESQLGSLEKQRIEKYQEQSAFYLKRLNPYSSDLINLIMCIF